MEPDLLPDVIASSDVGSHAAPSQDRFSVPLSRLRGDEEEKLVGVLLGGQFQVTEFLRYDNHANLYAVLNLHLPSECFEARVYELRDLPSRLRQYRLRNIKRLSSRSVLEDRWEGKTVIVYRSNNKTTQDGEVGEHKEPLEIQVPTSKLTTIPVDDTELKRETKTTTHQQESARLRQLERRQSKRRDRRQAEASRNTTQGTQNGSKVEVESPLETAKEEALYVLLYIAHSDRLQLRDQLPSGTRLALERYLEKKNLDFEDDNELEAFMKTKQHELLFLRRQQKKLPAVLKHHHDEFEQILRAKPPYHLQHKERQQSVQIAQHRYKIIRNVSNILPNVINEVDMVHRELRRRLTLARQKKKELENAIALRTERERLTKQIAAYEKCLWAVVPASGPYAQVVAQLAAAEKELRYFETRHSPSALSLDPLVEYKKLIGSRSDSTVSTQAHIDDFTQQIEKLNVMFWSTRSLI